jgi:hypothetical protein
MRFSFCLCALALLNACSVVPIQAWTFDPTQPKPKAAASVAEVVALTDRTAQLQIERNDIRARISLEPDARSRLGLYDNLHRVGMELSPLERRLASVAGAR